MIIIQLNCEHHWEEYNQLKFGFIINNRVYYLAGEYTKFRPWDFTHYSHYYKTKYNLIYKD